MMKFELEYIEKIAEIIAQKGLSEITLEDGEKAIIIKKEVIVNQSVAAVSAPVVQAQATPVAAKPVESAPAPQDKGIAITSPMVGTFYSAPSPDSDPFVEIGKVVSQGQVVCIIEAMKLMNEIEAEVSGKIVEICVEDGQPVEFGQVLMYVK